MKANTGQPQAKTTLQLIDALNGDGRATLAGVRAFSRPEAPDSVVVAYRHGMYASRTFDWLSAAADQAGWYRTRTEKDPTFLKVFFESKVTTAAPRPAELFHATKSEHVPDIIRGGLVPQTQGRTWLRRTYFTPRVFFASSLDNAIEFIRSMEGEGPAAQNCVALTAEILERWEVFCVAPGKRSYYPDVEFTSALWTAEPVGKEDLSVCKDWRVGRS